MTGNRRKLPGAENTPLKGYAPLVAMVVVFVAVAVVLPSKAPSSAAEGDAREVGVGQTASGWGETVDACTDRQAQVEGDGYSPPCFEFEGDNGGATTRGVTADEITVAYRVTPEPNIISTFAAAAGHRLRRDQRGPGQHDRGPRRVLQRELPDVRPQAALRAGRGQRQLVQEIYGAGQAAANTDAIKTATEVEAFADVSALSQPYADALARQEVINFGAPFLSREWFVERRPYSWSLLTDCTVIGETGTEYSLKRLLDRPAKWAGGSLEGQTRKTALIAPDNPEYQQCVAASERVIEEGGKQIDLVLDYNLNLAHAAPAGSRPCWPGCATPASPPSPAPATR